MSQAPPPPPNRLESLRQILVTLGRSHPGDAILEHLVELIAVNRPHLRRVAAWLTRDPADEAVAGGSTAETLYLAGSAHQEGVDTAAPWELDGGDFRRFPITEPLLGRAARARCLVVAKREEEWTPFPEWARREGLSAYIATPLMNGSDLFGIIAVFLDAPLGEDAAREGCTWLQLFADQAAASLALSRAFEEIRALRGRLELENEYLREEVSTTMAGGRLIGKSPALLRLLGQIELIAPTDASVLIIGESGTGKELIGREIHEKSRRRDRPLIKVNCAAIPYDLFESELFGHVKGSFTGAVRDRVGRFELANGGTLFLDEVGEIPLELQAKLLRVLQEGEFDRIGEEKSRRTDARIVAATNRNLKQEIEARRFRDDLYYRLDVFSLEVPPLRERPEDVPLLAAHFLERSCRRHGRPDMKLKKRDSDALLGYAWPGNVRELENAVERAVVLSRGGPLRFDVGAAQGGAPAARLPLPAAGDGPGEIFTYAHLEQLERDNIAAALAASRGKISGAGGAAELLGVKPSTLASRIKSLGVKRPE